MKKIIGSTEHVTITGSRGAVEAVALVDTGASNNSIDYKIAAKAGVGPVVSSVKVHSAFKHKRRPVVQLEIEIKGRRFRTMASLEDRIGRSYHVLLGRPLLKNFLVDISGSGTDTIGLVEPVSISAEKSAHALAKFDTGASRTSIDRKLAQKIGFRETKRIKIANAHDIQERPAGAVEIGLHGKKFRTLATLAEREHMSHPVLIGRDIIKYNYIIDVSKVKK